MNNANGEQRYRDVAQPISDCPVCRSRVREAEQEAGRLLESGASDEEVLRAAHEPRFGVLAEHHAALDEAGVGLKLGGTATGISGADTLERLRSRRPDADA